MQKTRVNQAKAALVFALTGTLLVGCPPRQYCHVLNATNQQVRIDFSFEGSGTLLPHFTLMPGESRRVTAGAFVTATGADGHIIGTLDLAALKNPSSYFDRTAPYTYHLRVTSSGIIPIKAR